MHGPIPVAVPFMPAPLPVRALCFVYVDGRQNDDASAEAWCGEGYGRDLGGDTDNGSSVPQ